MTARALSLCGRKAVSAQSQIKSVLMNDKTTVLDISFYAIIDKEWQQGRSLAQMTQAAIDGGATIVQYRDKRSDGREFYISAKEIAEVCRAAGTPFIVNDRIDVALAVKADGIHLGQNDIPLEIARGITGEQCVIGISAHTVGLGIQAVEQGADYLGVGAVFPTNTKNDAVLGGLHVIRELNKKIQCPIVGIGGITAENLSQVLEAGATGVAVISALLTGDIINNARSIKCAIDKAMRRGGEFGEDC